MKQYIYIYFYIYQMDCVCQRYHKECSTRMRGWLLLLLKKSTNDLSLDFFNNNIYILLLLHYYCTRTYTNWLPFLPRQCSRYYARLHTGRIHLLLTSQRNSISHILLHPVSRPYAATCCAKLMFVQYSDPASESLPIGSLESYYSCLLDSVGLVVIKQTHI